VLGRGLLESPVSQGVIRHRRGIFGSGRQGHGSDQAGPGRGAAGVALTDVRLLGVLENIFEWRGQQEHEIVFVFAAWFADPAAYEIAEQRIRDNVSEWTRVIWRPADAVSPPVYPDGVLDLVRRARWW